MQHTHESNAIIALGINAVRDSLTEPNWKSKYPEATPAYMDWPSFVTNPIARK
jgi:hypothetical protein